MLVAMPSTEPARGATGAPPDPPGHPLGVPRTPPDPPGHPLGVPRTPPAGAATAARLAAYRWGLALVGVTAVWGATFVMVRDAVAAIPPFTFIAYRFLAAAALLAAVRPRALARPQPGVLAAGLVTGVALFAGYGFQTVGLQYTTASNAGFITGLAVVLTPLLAAVLLRERPGLGPALGAALAFVGLGVLALAWSAVTGDLAAPAGAQVWLALAVTAVLASAAGFLVQTRAQREVSPTKTAVILTMEPVFAGLFGFLLAGERLEARGWAGACCILAGMLVAELGRPPSVPSRADDAFE